MYKSQATLFVVGFLVIAALTGYGILRAVEAAVRGPTETGQTIATRVQQLLNPTPTIYPDPGSVLLQVRALARLETAQYTIEKIITAETGQGLLGPLFGDKLIFVAHGEVIAGIDLSKLTENDIRVGPDGQVTLVLPPAEIFVATLNNDESYVYDRNTGLLTKGNTDLETMARQVAEEEIRKVALEDGILTLANTNGETFIERLLKSLKFTDIIFLQATPVPLILPTP